MSKYKKIGIVIVLTFIFSLFFLGVAKEKRDFIYVIPNIKNFEVLNPNFGNYKLEKLNSNGEDREIKKIDIFNGSIFYDVPNGEYKVIGEYFQDREEVILKKSKEWEKVYLNLEGITFTNLEEKFLLCLTFLLIIFNIYLYLQIQKKLPRGSALTYSFYLLTLKIFLSLRVFSNSNFFILIDFLITRINLYLLIFYFLYQIFPKRLKKLRVLIYLFLAIIYFYNVIIGLIIYSPQVLVYLLDEHRVFLSSIALIRRGIDLSRVLFLLLAITFIYNKKKIKRENIFSWTVLWISFFLLEFFKEIFPVAENLIYFIDLMELFSIYWFFIFYTFKFYSRNVLRVILYSMALTFSYLSLFYFKDMRESAIILGTVIILDFYAVIINRVMYIDNSKIKHIYNRLCLMDKIEEFEKFLATEIEREISVERVMVKVLIYPKEIEKYLVESLEERSVLPKEVLKLKEFDYALRIGFDKNKEVALIFIKENDTPLSLGEQNFLLELASKSANIINRLRLEYLYRRVR